MNVLQFLALAVACWFAASVVVLPFVWALCKAAASQRGAND